MAAAGGDRRSKMGNISEADNRGCRRHVELVDEAEKPFGNVVDDKPVLLDVFGRLGEQRCIDRVVLERDGASQRMARDHLAST